MVDDTYEYTAPNGSVFKGDVAFVLNHLDSAEASMTDNWRDLFDGMFNVEELTKELRLHDALNYLIDHIDDLAAYL